MLITFKLGFLLGLSIIISIGSQNIFIIQQAIKNEYSYVCALTCFASDLLLILLGVMGISALLLKLPMLKIMILILGVIFLTWYGISALKRAWKGNLMTVNLNTLKDEHRKNINLNKLILLGLSFSLLNPQAILDTIIIIGGSANQYASAAKYLFISGAVAASFVWFFSLTITMKYLSKKLVNNQFWQFLEFMSGGLMISVAGKFLLQAIK